MSAALQTPNQSLSWKLDTYIHSQVAGAYSEDSSDIYCVTPCLKKLYLLLQYDNETHRQGMSTMIQPLCGNIRSYAQILQLCTCEHPAHA